MCHHVQKTSQVYQIKNVVDLQDEFTRLGVTRVKNYANVFLQPAECILHIAYCIICNAYCAAGDWVMGQHDPFPWFGVILMHNLK